MPAIVGTLLWGAATALLLEDAIHTGNYSVATMATPVLTAATVASACLAHLRFQAWRLIGASGFLVLALLGSTVMATGTLGRLAEAKDGKEATIQATNRTYGIKDTELTKAKAERDKECRSMGPKCKDWQTRVDVLTADLAKIVVRSTDPKADAVARLASLIGGNGPKVKEIVATLDPILIPMFLELGSVGFFAGAFGHRKVRQELTVACAAAPVSDPATPRAAPSLPSRSTTLRLV
jgi:hypothetical protein